MIVVGQTTSVNTPSIKSDATALSANRERLGWSIQNLGTNPLFICLGGTASTSVFHYVLKGGSGNDDGLGATIGQMSGTVFFGAITVAGTSPRYTVLEHGTVTGTLN